MAQRAGYTVTDFYKIAKYQRRLLRTVLCSFLLVSGLVATYYFTLSVEETPEVTYIGFQSDISRALQLGLPVFTIVSCGIVAVIWFWNFVLLLAALRTHILTRIIAIIGSFVPLISFVVLGVILGRACRVLKRGGYSAGVMGVSKSTLRAIKDQPLWTPPVGLRPRQPTSLESHLDSN